MKKSLGFLLAIIFVLISVSGSAQADTGTYQILDYSITMTPKSNGLVEMEYWQKWRVDSGSIPWVTVGMPNSEFKILESDHNVAKIKNDSSGEWQGVRIDLDKNYKPGEIFEIGFKVSQNKFFWADEKNYGLDFTPGWYDNSFIDHLAIKMNFFAPIKKVTLKPEAKVLDEIASWEWKNLGKGQRVSISVRFPKEIGKGIVKENLKNNQDIGTIVLIAFIIIIVVILIIVVVAASGGFGDGDDDGYYGGGIFASGSSGSSRSGSGSGGFGGRSSSCACACVSCACACACAGGGGAGCDRKNQHQCEKCKGGINGKKQTSPFATFVNG